MPLIYLAVIAPPHRIEKIFFIIPSGKSKMGSVKREDRTGKTMFFFNFVVKYVYKYDRI